MKKAILGFVLGAVISVSGSVYAGTVIVQNKNVQKVPLVGNVVDKEVFIYDPVTKQVVKKPLISETEQRFRDIEARLEKLEKKKNR